MIIDCISDLHGYKPNLIGGDLLIVAGDLTGFDSEYEHINYIKWQNKQKYRKIIFIAGNHDGHIQKHNDLYLQRYNKDKKATYLCDTGIQFEGYKIWGSPWTPTFYDWHFMKDRGEEIKKKWDLIPQDTDILITHGPPFGVLDQVTYSSKAEDGKFAGCVDLRNAVRRIQPRLHVFGHIHEGYGHTKLNYEAKDSRCLNVSIMNEEYNPINQPIRVYL